MVDQLDRRLLSEDLDEIARDIPPVPRGLGFLRQQLALLPPPLGATLQPGLPVDEISPPSDAVDTLAGPGVGTISGAAIIGGSISAPQIHSGALHDVALFAANIRPVIIVSSLPTLPDASYPEGQIVYNTGDVPPALYKNESDTWVKLIGAVDIQANSITAGQIASGAINTDELAVGARLTGEYANETGLTPGVFIDSQGILIRDGKLTIEDEFGETTMEASGFSGSWADFILLGVYNARFRAGVVGTVPNGRTAALPYWTAADVVGTPTLSYTGPGIHISWGAQNDNKRITSDAFVARPGTTYEWGYMLACLGPTTKQVRSYIEWFDDAMQSLGTTDQHDQGYGTTGDLTDFSSERWAGLSLNNAAYGTLVLEFSEVGTHSSANEIQIGGVWAIPGNGYDEHKQVLTTLTVQAIGTTVAGSFAGQVFLDELRIDVDNADIRFTRGAAKTLLISDLVFSDLTSVVMQSKQLLVRGDSTDGNTEIRVRADTGDGASFVADVEGDSAGRAVLSGDASLTGLALGPGNASRDAYIYRSGASIIGIDDNLSSERLQIDASTGRITKYENNGWSSYGPSVGGIGSGANSTAVGYFQKIGKMVYVIIYLVCSANGTGTSNVTITTPSNPDRTTRQVLVGNSEGHGLAGVMTMVAFTGGSGAVWDRVRNNAGTNMIGTDYDSGGLLVFQGFYREA